MSLKSILMGMCCLAIAVTATAQDKILKRNGEVIDAKVGTIDRYDIIYRQSQTNYDREYSIPKSEVSKILYANGSHENFNANEVARDARIAERRAIISRGFPPPHPVRRENYNRTDDRPNRTEDKGTGDHNILAFSPLLFSEHGWGFGFNWEHTLDRSGVVSVNLPVSLTFNFAEQGVQRDPMFYFYPGIKIYTNLNSYSRNKFSIGPSLVFGAGYGTPSYNTYYGYNTSASQSHVLMGGMVNLGANFFPTSHLYLGIDLGMGLSYLNHYNDGTENQNFLMQLAFKIGYRYRDRPRMAAPATPVAPANNY